MRYTDASGIPYELIRRDNPSTRGPAVLLRAVHAVRPALRSHVLAEAMKYHPHVLVTQEQFAKEWHECQATS